MAGCVGETKGGSYLDAALLFVLTVFVLGGIVRDRFGKLERKESEAQRELARLRAEQRQAGLTMTPAGDDGTKTIRKDLAEHEAEIRVNQRDVADAREDSREARKLAEETARTVATMQGERAGELRSVKLFISVVGLLVSAVSLGASLLAYLFSGGPSDG